MKYNLVGEQGRQISPAGNGVDRIFHRRSFAFGVKKHPV